MRRATIDRGGTYPKIFGVGIRARIRSSSSTVTRSRPFLRQVPAGVCPAVDEGDHSAGHPRRRGYLWAT